MAYVDQIFSELNAQQRAAAAQLHRPVAIAAGAGAGKTKTMIARIAGLVSPWRAPETEEDPLTYEAPIDSLCVITFTNKAAREILDRLKPVFDEIAANGKRVPELAIGTFHSVSMRLLRRYANAAGMAANFTVADDDDAGGILADASRSRAERLFAWANLADAAALECMALSFSEAERKRLLEWLGLDAADLKGSSEDRPYARKLAAALVGFVPLDNGVADLEAAVMRRFSRKVGQAIEAAKNLMLDEADVAGGVDGAPHLFTAGAAVLDLPDAAEDIVYELLQRANDAGMETPGLWAFANALVDEEPPFDTLGAMACDIFAAYQQRLRGARILDFADLLNTMTRMLRDNPDIAANVRATYRHFIVDEAQDMNPAQMEWLRAMTGDGAPIDDVVYKEHERLQPRLRAWPLPSIALCGDQDQAIYGFRGSRPNLFTHRFAEVMAPTLGPVDVLKIETNYRCNASILALANASIAMSKDPDRIAKTLRPFAGAPLAIKPRYFQVSEHAVVSRGSGVGRAVLVERVHGRQARFHPPRRQARLGAALESLRDPGETMAILVRTRAQARAIHREMTACGVPAQLAGGADFHDGKAYKDALSYARLAFNPFDDAAFRRVRNNPARGLGDGSMKKIDEFARKDDLCAVAVAVALARQAPRQLEDNAADADGMGPNEIDVPKDLVPDRTKAKLRDFFLMMAKAREACLKQDRPEGGAQALLNLLERAGWAEKARADLDGDRALRGILAEAEQFRSLEDWLQTASLDAMDMVDEEAEKLRPPVVISTIHAAKGLEWDHVLVAGCVDGMIPFTAGDGDSDLEEERRLFFVAATRARKTLNFSGPAEIGACSFLREVFGQKLVGLAPEAKIPEKILDFTAPGLDALRQAMKRARDQDVYKLEGERLEAAIGKFDFMQMRGFVAKTEMANVTARARQEKDDRDALDRLLGALKRIFPNVQEQMAFEVACKHLFLNPNDPRLTQPRAPRPDPLEASASGDPTAAGEPEWAPYDEDPRQAAMQMAPF